jgi:hypothetical protein
MGLVYRIKKGSALSYSEMDANLATLSNATGSSVTGSSISGFTQTFQLGDGTSYTNTITSASYALKAVSASYSSYSFDSFTATSASYAISASHVEFADDAQLSVTASYAISASHVEFADDAQLSVTASYAISASHVEFADDAQLSVTASYAISASHVEFADDAQLSVTASHAISASHTETADLANAVPFSGVSGKPSLVSGSAQIDLGSATGTAALATQATTATTATTALSVSGSIEAVSFDSSGSFHISGSDVIFSGLSTTEPTTTGSLWLSGSGAGASSGSKYLMVFTG